MLDNLLPLSVSTPLGTNDVDRGGSEEEIQKIVPGTLGIFSLKIKTSKCSSEWGDQTYIMIKPVLRSIN
jgi:hypothetical protein